MLALVTRSFRPLSVLTRTSAHAMSTSAAAPLLVSPKDLSNDVVFIDASWHMPGSPRNPLEEYKQKHIAGARYLDLDVVASENERGLKHMMPTSRVFARAMGSLGVTPSSHVVLYDSQGVFSSPRALFMLRAFGHTQSSVLDGGLPRWIAEGGPVHSNPSKVQEAEYAEPQYNEDVIRSYEQVVANSKKAPAADGNIELLVDARSRGRWLGTDPEPRKGLSSGHIPHSFSLPFQSFLKTVESSSGEKYTVFRSKEEIEAEVGDVLGVEFMKQAKEGERSIITSCGSGMTAGVLWLGLQLLQINSIRLYDESWTGYASREDSVIQRAT